MFGFAIGACINLLPPEPVPFFVAACTIVAELCQYRSDAVKGTAQRLRRKLDLQDGFGWQLPSTELSDLIVCSPAGVKKRANNRPVTDPYFASLEPPGPMRVLKNVSESAWWTKSLSRGMVTICFTMVSVGIAVAFIILIFALLNTTTHTIQANVARIVTGVLMLQMSLGVIKLAIGYTSLKNNSAASEAAAELAIQTTPQPDQITAFKVLYDYHLTRAVGPIIPTWIWKVRKDELNQIWQEIRNKR